MSKSTPSTSSYIELAYSSVRAFADDGKLDERELAFLLGLALRDGEIDDDERRVLRNIFTQAAEAGLDSVTASRIAAARRKHNI